MNRERAFIDMKVAIVVVLLIAALGAGAIYTGRVNIPTTDKTGTQNEVVAEEYRDGTYSVVGNYTSPGGPRTINVELAIEDGVIVEASVEATATDPVSKKNQDDFTANYKTQVVGKNLSDLKLERVSGSSLTPKGFNDALEKVRKEARV